MTDINKMFYKSGRASLFDFNHVGNQSCSFYPWLLALCCNMSDRKKLIVLGSKDME